MMKKSAGAGKGSQWPLLAPIYIFTLLFVLLPMLYMFLLSFLTRAEVWGVDFHFTLDNYRRIGEPLYRNTFLESFRLAFLSTVLVVLLGYPYGYFMARMNAVWKKRMLLLIMIPFWTSALIRLYGWIIVFRSNGVLDKVLMGLRITEKPLKLLYTYPAVVVGMVYALLPFMILAVYSSAEKMDWTLVEAARDLGASSFRAFWTVTFKMTLPGLLSGIILTFIPSTLWSRTGSPHHLVISARFPLWASTSIPRTPLSIKAISLYTEVFSIILPLGASTFPRTPLL